MAKMSIFGPNFPRLPLSFYTAYYALTLCTKLGKSNERILRYMAKMSILGPNLPRLLKTRFSEI